MKLDTQLVLHAMHFDIIVTYSFDLGTVNKLMKAEQLLKKSQQQVAPYQAHFEIDVMIDSAMTYDAVMMDVRDAVFDVSEQTLAIDREEIVKISTCGEWRRWERLTGRDSAADDASSTICRNGTFWF